MSFDGGFAAVVFVRQHVVDDLVRAMHYRHGDHFRVALSRTLTLAGHSAVISGALFVEKPVVTLHAADGKVRVALSAWARVRVQVGGDDEACLARLTAQLLVPLTIDDKGWDEVFLDLSRFEIAAAEVRVPWTSGPAGHGPALSASPEFRALLLDAVRPTAKRLLRVSIPIDRIMQMQSSLVVQSVPFVPRVRLTALTVMDGALAAGFDLFSGITQESHGDAGTLELPWARWAALGAVDGGPVDDEHAVQAMLAVQPAVLLKYGGFNIQFQVKMQPLPDDRRIDEVVLGLSHGVATLLVRATAVHDDPFPDDRIHILLSFVPMGTFIKITDTKVVFSSAGIGGLLDLFGGLVTDYVRSVVMDHVASAGLKINWALSGARFNGPLPGAEGSPGHAVIRVTPARTAIDPAFVLSGISASVSRAHGTNGGFDDPADDPDTLPTAAGLASGPPEPFRMQVRVGDQDPAVFWPIRAQHLTLQHAEHPTLRRDPSLRTVWWVDVTRQDGTTTTFEQDRWSDDAGARALAIDLWSDAYYHSAMLDVRCAHYRPFEDRDAALAAVGRTRVYITDRFRRDFPFVRWHRYVSWVKTVDGMQVPESKLRRSAVHRTDIRQRCRFCDVGGTSRAYGSADQTQHLTSLPAPAEDDFRVELCPFCFTGA